MTRTDRPSSKTYTIKRRNPMARAVGFLRHQVIPNKKKNWKPTIDMAE